MAAMTSPSSSYTGDARKVEVAGLAAQVLEEIRRLVGPLDDRGFLDLLGPVVPLEGLHVLIDDEIGDEGPSFGQFPC